MRLRESWRQRGAGEAELGWTDHVLDPDVLTIGFARRVPSYKRLTLMLRDQNRLTELLLHPERPVQIVVAGKAHPADDGGKRLVQELVRFTDDPRVRHRIVFLPDYDMRMARLLYPGCDVWLNNPLRPLEACGTSGMKAALNGCLNLSVLDGWWDEWYDGDNGWAIPTADGIADEDRRDALEAAALYDLLEHQVAPRFYDHGTQGLPGRWIEMVRHTLTTLGPKVLVEAVWSGTTSTSCTRPPRAPTAPYRGRPPSHWPSGSGGYGSGGRRSPSTMSRPARSTALRSWGPPSRCGPRCHWAGSTPRTSTCSLLSGRVDAADRLGAPTALSLKVTGRADVSGRYAYEGPLTLDRTGAFGYTVRVL